MVGLDQVLVPVSNVMEIVCRNCGRNHPTGPNFNGDNVIIGFGVIVMIVTCFLGFLNYIENQEDTSYKKKPKENKNIWKCMRWVYRYRRDHGHGPLDGLWYVYTMFNFTTLCFLAVMFPVTIILPLCVGTLKQILIYVTWYYGSSIFGMIALTIVGWYLMLVGCTFTMFKPISKETKDE